MRFINLTFLITFASVISASGLTGRHHEGGDDDDSHSSSMGSMSMSSTSSSLSPSPTVSSANAGASSSSAAAFHIAQPAGALTGALAVVVAMMA